MANSRPKIPLSRSWLTRTGRSVSTNVRIVFVLLVVYEVSRQRAMSVAPSTWLGTAFSLRRIRSWQDYSLMPRGNQRILKSKGSCRCVRVKQIDPTDLWGSRIRSAETFPTIGIYVYQTGARQFIGSKGGNTVAFQYSHRWAYVGGWEQMDRSCRPSLQIECHYTIFGPCVHYSGLCLFCYICMISSWGPPKWNGGIQALGRRFPQPASDFVDSEVIPTSDWHVSWSMKGLRLPLTSTLQTVLNPFIMVIDDPPLFDDAIAGHEKLTNISKQHCWSIES